MKTLKQAFAHARRLWGKTAAVKDRGRKFALTQQQRDEAKATWTALKENRDTIKRDTIEQRLQRRPIQKEMDGLFWKIHTKRYVVGKVMMGLFFEVRGEGDTWDDAFAEAERKYPQQKAA